MRQALRTTRGRSPTRQALGTAPAKGVSLPAPTGGWDAISSLANMKPDRAIVLDNWFPRPDSVEVRRGSEFHSGGVTTDPIESLMVYQGVNEAASKMFAVGHDVIYDVSASGLMSATANTGLANNRWQSVNFTTPGGKFLWACNGADQPRHFDGSGWTLASLSAVTASDIIAVSVHKHRLWFCFNDSTKAGYLPVSSIDGTVSLFEFGSVFSKGGFLTATGTITRDSGAGEDDLFAAFSSEGEVVVYQGTDPSSSTTWSLVGVYTVGDPIGRRCLLKVGGGVAMLNIDGLIPIPQALSIERESIASVAITKNINNAMNTAARSYKGNFGWQPLQYPKGNMVIINVPIQEGVEQHQYVMNALTGAWCRFKGWNANCFAVFNDNLYFGGNDGNVYRADIGSIDVTTPVDAIGQGAYNYYNSRGVLKNFGHARAIVTTDSDVLPAIGMSTDFRDNATLGTPTSAAVQSALYDTAIYDTDVYSQEDRTVADWASIQAEGHSASIHFRARTGPVTGAGVWGISKWGSGQWSGSLTGDVVLRVNAFDVQYTTGTIM